ncbi:MAG TPA: 3-ketoacyl-ACP reductase [Firmicutes bacterium]|nr:3-ketoacyl-ACP reductase [Bacillota bacterium]
MTQQVALVTGSSRGIGRGIALALAEVGFHVAVNYASRREAAEEVADAIRARGVEADVFGGDIGDDAQRDELYEAVMRRFGRIDVLVNNAGVAPQKRLDLLETEPAGFDRLMRINLRGPFFLTQKVAKQMIALVRRDPQARPKIINVGSVSAYAASVNRPEYCLSKAGVGMMTRLFAARLAEYGILVYEVRPGIIATDMTAAVKAKYDELIANNITPIKRWGTPEDVGRTVAGIATDMLPFSTGEVINVDGGFHIRQL